MDAMLSYERALADKAIAERRLLSDPLVYNAVQHIKRAGEITNQAERETLFAQVLIAFAAAERRRRPLVLEVHGSFPV